MSIISLIKTVLDFIMAIPGWIVDLVNSQVQSDLEKRRDAIKKGTEDAKKAKTTEEKANAACEIEKGLNPDSNCDTKPSK